MNVQNDRERLIDRMQQGLITAAEANVEMVRNERFRIVNKLPRDLRNTLNKAVKEGKLGHMKKDGLKPEIYFHPTFKYLATGARNEKVNAGIRALKKIAI